MIKIIKWKRFRQYNKVHISKQKIITELKFIRKKNGLCVTE